MSFALEDVWLRTTDAALKQRAEALAETVRKAFIAYHVETTFGFQLPPSRAVDDALNAWVTLPAGTFMMGSGDSDIDERPHEVSVTAFSMKQHEVTNEEYRRFDPAHKFTAGEENHPVTNVSWYDAAAYAAWLGASLPTDVEGE